MQFIDQIIEQAQAHPTRILLPESEDERTLRAAAELQRRRIADVCLIGDPAVVTRALHGYGIRESIEVVNPLSPERLEPFTGMYHEMRRRKGMTLSEAESVMQNPIAHGIMMLHLDQADGLVAGACHSTAATLRPALQILRTREGCSMVSSFFFMTLGETTYLFADCGLVENPNAEELAEIALSSAETALQFGIDPYVAMLSYSTLGSADSPLTRKVVEATQIAKSRCAERFGGNSAVRIDGELQVDAAIVESVARRKAPDSEVAGRARVLVFPDLNSGNMAYKLVERLAGASAYGPILQGIRKPVNDLSRGCSWEDIVGVAAVTVVQSQMHAATSLR
ncbi:MAG: hypothetical protein AMXMBFR84_42660 [Candidatus Hydrogenedentota bacterium]